MPVLVLATAMAMTMPASATEPTAPLGGDDLAAAQQLEDRMGATSLHEGQAIGVDLDASGYVASTYDWRDSGVWTGVYEGGEALRYGLATKKIATTSGQEQLDWHSQRDAALDRLRATLAAEHRDIAIAQDRADAAGLAGMMMRACTPVGLGVLGIPDPVAGDDTAVQITWRHGDGRTYNCLTSPGRDTYAGVVFGMLTAFDMLTDQPGLRTQVRGDLLALGNVLLATGWAYPGLQGGVTSSRETGVTETPASRMVLNAPLARLDVANAVRHVQAQGGSFAAFAQWSAVWAEELASQGPALSATLQSDAIQTNEHYGTLLMDHLNAFDLLRTTSFAERAVLAPAVAVMDKTTGDDLNAQFEAITYAMTGEAARRDAAVTHLREWRVYKARVEAGGDRVNGLRCAYGEEDCAFYGTFRTTGPTGDVSLVLPVGGPGESDVHALVPLQVVDRPRTPFLWNREPTRYNDVYLEPTHLQPGIDYLTPYWMVRYYTEAVTPALSPLPTYPGPAYL